MSTNTLGYLLVSCDTLEQFKTYKRAYNDTNSSYITGDETTQAVDGTPDIAYESLVFIKDKGYIWTRGRFYGELETANLHLGDGLTKTNNDGVISLSLDTNFLKNYIEQYITNFVNNNWFDDLSNWTPEDSDNPEIPSNIMYDVLANCINYKNDTSYTWYNFDNILSNIIIFNETAVIPTGTVNFGDKFLPSFTMTLSKTLNLDETPYINIQYFTLNSAPLNFKFVDVNGKCSAPIIAGQLSAGTSIVIDTSSYQTDTSKKITSLGSGGYTNKSTVIDINNYLNDTIIPEFNSKGEYSKTAKSSILNILEDLPNGFITSYEDEGFDRTKIKSICVEFVENWDKTSITFKERYKALIFNKFIFTAEK